MCWNGLTVKRSGSLPAVTDTFVRGESDESFVAVGKGVSCQKGMQACVHMGVGPVVIVDIFTR
jgi:hypothetical protein